MPWIKVAKAADIPDGEIRALPAGEKKVAVAHVGAEFFAIDDTCTHAQCSLAEGTLVDHELECPCHGSRFDVASGAVRSLPATVPLKTYPLKVEGEEIFVEI
uniref:Non-heme iron oxygenase ferredoxin subunit n=1 Tax=candidate division WWE3 bacterium TaxID=2053526 RepID=A0A831Z2Y6_UNCKA